MDLKLKGKVAVITGAAQGIGMATAEALAKEGVNLVLGDIRKFEKDQVERLKKSGVKVATIQADVTSTADIEALFSLVDREMGKVDILFNNAGILAEALIHEMSDDAWDKTMNINLKGVFCCSKAAAKRMIPQKSGKIINISSFNAWIPVTGFGAYCISKMGVITLTKTMAGELGPYGISVMAVAPGMLESDMNVELRKKGGKDLVKPISAGRIGKISDLVPTILYLCSSYADYMTGAIVEVSGGRLAVQNPWVAYSKAGVEI